MTADAAVEGIRQVDSAGSIGLIGDESHPPYDRPPLSKGLWKDKPLESIWRKAAAREAALHLGRKAVTLDPSQKSVRDDRGTVYRYEKLLLATGGAPHRLPADSDSVLYFRTLERLPLSALLGPREEAICGHRRRIHRLGDRRRVADERQATW